MPNDLQGLQLLGNALALPKRLENASQQSAMTRALLSQNADVLGLTPAQIDQLAPDPGLGAINPTQHPGTYGKILSGVGGVGNVISSLLGNPVEAPRLDLSTITSLGGLRDKEKKEKNLETYADTFAGDERAQAAIRAGKTPPGQGRGGGELGLLERISTATNPAERKRLEAIRDDLRKSKQDNALAVGRGMTPIIEERTQNAADISLRKKFQEDAGAKLTQLGNVERQVFPMMRDAQKALTTNPAVAGLGAQRPYLWWKALRGDAGAIAVKALPSQAAALARTQDVGNLSGPEQEVYYAFLNGEDMTAQQFGQAMGILQRLLGSSAKFYREQLKTGDVPLTESEQAPPESGKPPAPGGGGGDELDQLLKQHGH